MKRFVTIAIAAALMALPGHASAQHGPPNRIVGTWTMASAQLDPQGANTPAYGPNPHGWLVFTKELTFIEVMTDPRVPKFASNVRGKGTDDENRAAMAGSIGFYGRYAVDQDGEFSGNRVEGATFPNWVGDVRTRKELQMTVDRDTMTEQFRRPDGTAVRIVWERIR
ncbi:MAG: hypothetical protein JWQ94_152 [Tardiphaga sp.]|jgi:hypothetical protein|nr:hypothetical protein [Tardiphaga sp.]